MEKRKRRALVVLAVLVGLLGITAAGALLFSGDGFSGAGDVHVIYLQGQMVTAYSPVGVGVASSEAVSEQIRDSADSGAEAIVLRINSPGGTPAAAQELVDAVNYSRSQGTPVVASVGDLGASAAYYTASEADRIVANPDSLTGSIGVIWLFNNSTAKFRKEGINYTIVKSGEFKDMGYPQTGLNEDEERYAQQVVDSSYRRFVEQVAEGRDIPVSEVEELSDGRIYTGQRAKELGLVDRLGSLQESIDLARNVSGSPEAGVRYVNRPSLARLLLGGANVEGATGYFEGHARLWSGPPPR